MDLLTEIKRLTAERGSLLARVRDIDTQLNAVRDALSPRVIVNAAIKAEVKPRAPRAKPGELGLTEQRIVEELSKAEPQTAQMLHDRIGGTTVKSAVGVMFRKCLLYREGGTHVGRGIGPYWYARTPEGLKGKPEPSPDADDELGRLVPSFEDGELITSDRDGSLVS